MNSENSSTSDQSENTSAKPVLSGAEGLSVTKEMPFVIPVEGSLGLLALGHIGIREWRKVREESKKSEKK